MLLVLELQQWTKDKIPDLMHLTLYQAEEEGAYSKINNIWWNFEEKLGKEGDRWSWDQETPVWWNDIWNEGVGPAEVWVRPTHVGGEMASAKDEQERNALDLLEEPEGQWLLVRSKGRVIQMI